MRFSTHRKENQEEEEKKILDEYHQLALEAIKNIDKNSSVIQLNDTAANNTQA
jgi:hypothetical protein